MNGWIEWIILTVMVLHGVLVCLFLWVTRTRPPPETTLDTPPTPIAKKTVDNEYVPPYIGPRSR